MPHGVAGPKALWADSLGMVGPSSTSFRSKLLFLCVLAGLGPGHLVGGTWLDIGSCGLSHTWPFSGRN